MMQDRCV